LSSPEHTFWRREGIAGEVWDWEHRSGERILATPAPREWPVITSW